jgi:hypothetical protein
MGPTRTRDLAVAVVAAAVFGYAVVRTLYRYFPPITLLTGLSLLALAAAEAVWAVSIRSRIRDGRIGVGAGRLHPLAVARSVAVAKASAWVGAVMLGWWTGVLAYLVPRRSELRFAAVDAPGVATSAISAFALVVAALWLQHCCKSPGEPGETDPSATALGSD